MRSTPSCRRCRYADALKPADPTRDLRERSEEIAALEGMTISFMAKFDEREGSSCHIHLSLRDELGALFDAGVTDWERIRGFERV